MSADNFFGKRLRVARNFRGLRVEELASQMGLTKQFVSFLENDKRRPTDLIVRACADVLGFAPAYFREALVDEFRQSECAFRKLITTPAFAIKRVLAHGTLFAQMVAALEAVVSLPADRVPRVSARDAEEIEEAAARCRSAWKLDADAPLKDLTRLLEHAGIVVTAFKGSAEKVDAFSRARAGQRKIVVANYDKENPFVYRWSIAHELGHLVLHRAPDLATRERELEADHFAARFLMPRGGFAREFPRPGTHGQFNWDRIFRLRQRWGVGIKQLVRRAFEVKALTPAQYQRAYKYLHAHGWHRDEADVIKHETPELISTMFASLPQTPMGSPLELARQLHWTPKTLQEVSGLPVQRAAVLPMERRGQ